MQKSMKTYLEINIRLAEANWTKAGLPLFLCAEN